jgi:hypothetical protein
VVHSPEKLKEQETDVRISNTGPYPLDNCEVFDWSELLTPGPWKIIQSVI